MVYGAHLANDKVVHHHMEAEVGLKVDKDRLARRFKTSSTSKAK